MGRIYLVRHGQSVAQAEGKTAGLYPFDLTVKGEEQAYTAGANLLDKNIDFIFCSKVLRAKRTAQIIVDSIKRPLKPFILDHNLAYIEAFNERTHGVWDNMTYDELGELFYPKVAYDWCSTIDSCSPGGESLRDVYNRAIPVFYERVYKMAKEQNKNVLLVSHNRVMQAIMTFLYHDRIEKMIDVNVKNGVVYDFLV